MAEYRPLIRLAGRNRELPPGDTVGGRYDLSSGPITGKPDASEVLMDFAAPVAFTLPANLSGSVALASTAPAASATLTLTKNGTSVASITFAAGATVATFTAASAVSFAVSDRLQLVAPATQDGALAGLTFTFAGAR